MPVGSEHERNTLNFLTLPQRGTMVLGRLRDTIGHGSLNPTPDHQPSGRRAGAAWRHPASFRAPVARAAQATHRRAAAGPAGADPASCAPAHPARQPCPRVRSTVSARSCPVVAAAITRPAAGHDMGESTSRPAPAGRAGHRPKNEGGLLPTLRRQAPPRRTREAFTRSAVVPLTSPTKGTTSSGRRLLPTERSRSGELEPVIVRGHRVLRLVSCCPCGPRTTGADRRPAWQDRIVEGWPSGGGR